MNPIEKFKLNSYKRLGDLLFGTLHFVPKKAGKSAPSTDQDTIEALRDEETVPSRLALLEALLAWKGNFSTVNSLRKLPERVQSGFMYPEWKTIGFNDGTARMYATDPSITSLPKAIRKMMKAPEGFTWVGWDWKQAELRILAYLSQDLALLTALEASDFHKAVYAMMMQVPVESVTPEQREQAKIISYGLLYSGGNPYTVANGLRSTPEYAKEMIDRYFEAFFVLKAYLDEIRKTAADTWHVKTYMNRSRRLNGDSVEKRQNQATNSVGQQSCGTLLKVALREMAHLDQHESFHMCQVVPVFDAVYCCVPSDRVQEFITKMIPVVELKLGPVTLRTEWMIGPTWGHVIKESE